MRGCTVYCARTLLNEIIPRRLLSVNNIEEVINGEIVGLQEQQKLVPILIRYLGWLLERLVFLGPANPQVRHPQLDLVVLQSGRFLNFNKAGLVQVYYVLQIRLVQAPAKSRAHVTLEISLCKKFLLEI